MVFLAFSSFATLALLHGAEGLQLSAEGKRNICARDHLVPEFFLLGSSLSGITEFQELFSLHPGIVPATVDKGQPVFRQWESGWFDAPLTLAEKGDWASHYPGCQHAERKVAVDCTPSYLGNRHAPFSIKKFYPHRLGRRLKFFVFLSEPVARMHAHYYMWKENGATEDLLPGCPKNLFPKSFHHAVTRRMLTGTMCNCSCDNIFQDSMYVDGLKRYFVKFDASQFDIVPHGSTLDEDVVKHAWKSLQLEPPQTFHELADRAKKKQIERPWHPELVAELDEPTLIAVEKWADLKAGPAVLGHLLAGSGARLFKFKGKSHNHTQISRWLKRRWRY